MVTRRPRRPQQPAEAGGREALAERGGDASGDEHVLGRVGGAIFTGFDPIRGWADATERHAQIAPPRAARGRGPGRCRSRPGRPASGDSSRSRPSSSSVVSPELVTEPSLDFSTTTCRSAYAATCGRWVTTSTWAVRASGPAGGRPRPRPLRRPRRRPRRRRTSAPGWCRPATPRAPASPGTAHRRRRPCAAVAARSRCWRRAGTRPRRRRTGPGATVADRRDR